MWTFRKADRQTEKQTYIKNEMHTGRQTDRQTMKINRQADVRTYRQADRQKNNHKQHKD